MIHSISSLDGNTENEISSNTPLSLSFKENESLGEQSGEEEEEYFLLSDLVDNDLDMFTEHKTTSLSKSESTVNTPVSHEHQGSVSFHVRNLSMATDASYLNDEQASISREWDATKNIILDDISLDIPESCICGIIGGSGSGKTTLLNYLMNTYNNTGDVFESLKKHIPGKNYELYTRGEYYFKTSDKDDGNIANKKNGVLSSRTEIKIAYLQQYDFLPNDLTPVEILQCAADLKLKNYSAQKKTEIIEILLLELGLRDCKDTRLNNAPSQSSNTGDVSKNKASLSGGEKRRLGIAIQMISNPKILFLDEPTTGLDSYSAILLLNTLQKMRNLYGTTFILSIHQPRADIFSKYLDQLIILSTGKLLYCDKADKMIEYFTQTCNIPLPLNFLNPCDYYIDKCSIDNRSPKAAKESWERLLELETKWKNHRSLEGGNRNKDLGQGNRVLEKVVFVNPHVDYWTQIKVQFKRNLQLSWRDHWTFIGIYMEPIIIACITGWIFFRPLKKLSVESEPTSLQIRTITSSLYTATALQGYLFLLFETYRLCSTDIKLYDMERLKTNRVVTPFTFMVARKLSKLLLEDIIVPLIFSIITYFMYGLDVSHGNINSTFVNFLIFFSIILINHQVSANLALLSVSVSRDFSQASLVGNLFFTLQSIAGGFFVNAKDMPVYVRWTKYITFFWPSFGAAVSNNFTDSKLLVYKQYLVSLGFPSNWITVPIILVLCWAIGFSMVALLIFNMKTFEFNQINSSNIKFQAKKIKKEDIDDINESDKEKTREPDVQIEDMGNSFAENIGLDIPSKGVNIELKDLTLKHKEKYILTSVNAIFKKNELNIIMGPSGSGKSTLLNIISNRFDKSSAYKMNGSILLNDKAVQPHELKSHISYVKQHEDHLLSRLTVWETLYYSGKLKLVSFTDQEVQDRVEQLIMDLGIWHCKDVLIGDEFSKGISGGEKKRVSIGVQLLTNPSIVLLDEPTSGLDSFTAFNIMKLLEKISRTTTVIATIHQPRSEIFESFGNILLLGKQGKVTFNGPPSVMKEFFMDHLGFKCPKITNIADFYLDLISLNTQNDANEKISQERITRIIDNWETFKAENKIFAEPALTNSNQDLSDIRAFTKHANPLILYRICLIRQFKNLVRNMNPLLARLIQVPSMGIILALYFAPLKHVGEAAILNRFGLVQQATSVYFVGMLSNLAIYPGERNFFYNEYQDGVHNKSLWPFFCSYMSIELPMSLLGSIFYAIFAVLVTGLPRTAYNFFWTVYGAFIFMTCGESLGIITNTLFPQPGFVVNAISIVISLGCCMSGIMSLNMDVVLKVINWFSPLNFVVISLINNAFPESLKLTMSSGITVTGRQILEEFKIYKSNKDYMIYATLVMIGYRLIAYFVILWKLRKL